MRRFWPNPFHQRLLDVVPNDGDRAEFRDLVARSGLRLAEVPIPLAELVNEGYLTCETTPNGHGGMDRVYTRRERPMRESTIVREDDGWASDSSESVSGSDGSARPPTTAK